MQVTINTAPVAQDWSAKGKQRIIQNVQNLFALTAYEVAYDRTRGLPEDITDAPAGDAVARFSAHAADLLERCEPRARLIRAKPVRLSADGTLIFEVVINIVA